MATTTPNFGWDIPQSTDLVKDGATAIAALGTDIDTAFVDLKGGTTGQILSKNSNTDLDFTWVANDVGDITAVTAGTGITGGGTSGAVTITNDMATTITAAGDILLGTGSATYDNLPIGTTGQVLTADTTVSPYKAKWATPVTGGMTLLSTTTLSGATVTVSSISQDYINLFIIIKSMKNNTADGAFRVALNGTTNSHDGVVARFEQGGSATLSGFANNYIITPSNLARANATNTFALLLPGYASDAWKTFSMFGRYTSSTASTPIQISGMYGDQTAISSIAFSNSGGNLSEGTVLIYGVK